MSKEELNREIKYRVWSDLDDQFFFRKIEDSGIVSLYTGLKDKNGVEIYEGDIVSDSWSDEDVAPVVYEGNAFTLGFAYAETACMQLEDGEVIGNIYENPELLGGNDV